MKTIQLTEANTDLYSILMEVENGKELAISYGNKNQSIAIITSYEKWKKSQKRQLGSLEGKMSVEFAKNFAITDEELINL